MNIKNLLSAVDSKTVNKIVNWLIVIRNSDCVDCYTENDLKSPRKMIDEQLELLQDNCFVMSYDCEFSIAKKVNLKRFFSLIGTENAIEFYEWLETICKNDKTNCFNPLTPKNIILHHFDIKNVNKPNY